MAQEACVKWSQIKADGDPYTQVGRYVNSEWGKGDLSHEGVIDGILRGLYGVEEWHDAVEAGSDPDSGVTASSYHADWVGNQIRISGFPDGLSVVKQGCAGGIQESIFLMFDDDAREWTIKRVE
jgi:hypothetical protein